MSSDSDSDICDVSTNIKKFMSKQKDEFWKTYKPPTDTPTVSLAVSDNEDDKAVEVLSARAMRSNKRKSEPDEDVVETKEESTSNDLMGKLNSLTENISNFMAEVGTGRKRTRKGARRSRGRFTRASARNREPSTVEEVIANVARGRGRGRVTRSSARQPPTVELEVSTDEEPETDVNPIVEVNVLWKSIEPKQFKVRKFDKLTGIFDYLKSESNVEPELLYFTVDDKEVDLRRHSYVSLRLEPTTIVEGSVLPDSYLERRRSNELRPQGMQFKVQCGGRKNFEVRLLPSDTLDVLYSRVANELDADITKVKVTFDGSLVRHDDTIAGLKLEENDIFDAVIT